MFILVFNENTVNHNNNNNSHSKHNKVSIKALLCTL